MYRVQYYPWFQASTEVLDVSSKDNSIILKFPEDKGGVLYPAPNANTTEISQGDKETSVANKLFCVRSKQELVKREEKGGQAR